MRASNKTSEIVLFAVLFLFFLQVLSDFIESIYAFGLLVTAFTIQLASVLLLFTPLLWLLVRKTPSRAWMIGLGAVAVLGRLVEPMLNPGGKLVACGVSVGAFMVLFPLLLASARRKSSALAASLLIAVSVSIFLRAAHSSLDLSESGIYQLIAWVLGALAGGLIWRLGLFGSGQARDPKPARAPGKSKDSASLAVEGTAASPSMNRVIGLCIGLASVIIMLYFAFASPTVIARWTGYSYLTIISVLGVVLTIFALVTSSADWTSYGQSPNRFYSLLRSARVIQGWNALFIVVLVLTILPHQILFPVKAQAYPFDALAVSPWSMLPLFLMLVLSPIVFIDFGLYVHQLSEDSPSIRQLGVGFGLAALFMLVMVFFHVFTSIYDYAPGIGPLFRDRFWLVYLLAGLGLSLPLLLIRRGAKQQRAQQPTPPPEGIPFAAVMVGSLAILSIAAAYFSLSRSGLIRPSTTSQLRVMTYNIQQGFDKVGNENLQGQLDVIRQVEPDVLGLQESDTARVANGNVDAVRFLASGLNMYSYYGPKTTTGTFGIALLSKFPIQGAHTFFMYSTGEQTAAIQAQITVDGKTYNLFVTHLGNDGPPVQLQDVLRRVDGLPNVILVGDFNFNASTPQYALATQTLADAWLLRWPAGKDIPGLGSDGRIDQIFVSPGTQVVESEYVVNPASDHPYLYAVVKP
jgi:endonuclease/exonuclease/phosphatase family metal-dependent hydrolase